MSDTGLAMLEGTLTWSRTWPVEEERAVIWRVYDAIDFDTPTT